VRRSSRRSRSRGQILVLFVLALVAIIAGVGLVIDGGFTFAQRRSEQNAADLAAFAGANALLNGQDETAAALATAADNGYTDGSGGIAVDVAATSTTVKVDITAPHSNYFAGVVGQPTWDVSVTATALAGIPKRFSGIAPFILSIENFDEDSGLPFDIYTDPTDYTKTQGQGSDQPLTVLNMAWTNLGTGNVSTDDVRNIIDGSAPLNADLALNDYIGQQNNGVHNTLFDSTSQPSIQANLAGTDVPVPIVGPPIGGPGTFCNDGTHDAGCFRGWALFHVVSANKLGGGEEGTITGYFLTGITRSASASDVCAITDATCGGFFHGIYVIKLID
jgi:hypothetical protein